MTTVTNLASTLIKLGHYSEAKSLLREKAPSSRWINRNGRPDLVHTAIQADWYLAKAVVRDNDATLEEVSEGVTKLEGILRRSERVFGRDHPMSSGIRKDLVVGRARLARETS